MLTIRHAPGWDDIGASATVRGEVQHAGRMEFDRVSGSALLERAGGFFARAYPYGAVLMRRDVREIEMKSHIALVERMKAEQINLKALPEADVDQKNAKLTAVAETETTLTQLESTAPVGRVVVHIQPDISRWQHTTADAELRDGDVILIPKKANYVTVTGQVFNQTAISYRPGHSAKWYLSQAGGLTQIADKKAVFVIRADGSVLAAKNNAGMVGRRSLKCILKTRRLDCRARNDAKKSEPETGRQPCNRRRSPPLSRFPSLTSSPNDDKSRKGGQGGGSGVRVDCNRSDGRGAGCPCPCKAPATERAATRWAAIKR